MTKTITVFKGDGIGPEITDAVLKILDKASADLNYEIFNVFIWFEKIEFITKLVAGILTQGALGF